MNRGLHGFSRILQVARATNLWVVGKAGATAGAGLAGGTASGAPTSGSFDAGEAVIGQDGTLWICTAAGSPGTWTQVSGGGGSAQTLLATQSVGGSPVASLTFSAIPGGYNSLRLIGQLRTSGTTNPTRLLIQFNADTGSNYDWEQRDFYGAGLTNAIGGTAATSMTTISLYEATGIGANDGSIFSLWIPNYAGTSFNKGLSGTGQEWGSSVNHFGGSWRNTAAITSIKLLPTANNFAANGVVWLYAE